ncbi:MAG: cyclase family protein [Mucilaginibacter sp.]
MYIRLSHMLSQNTPSYGNRDKVIIRKNSSILAGETANSSCWIFSNNHIGTHIDSPRHFSETGTNLHEFPIGDFFFTKVQLIDIVCDTGILIGIEEVAKFESQISEDIELLLIRTGYGQYRTIDKYWNDGPGINAELADYLRKKYTNLRCIGFDFISLTSWNYRSEGRISHTAFLCPGDQKKPILVIEDMALENVTKDIVKLIVAPIFVEDGNGGAVTVFAEIKS